MSIEKRRRTPAEQVEVLRAAKTRAEAAIARIEARAREVERKTGLRRRAILGAEAMALFQEQSPEGTAFRALMAQRVKLPRHRAGLGLAPL